MRGFRGFLFHLPFLNPSSQSDTAMSTHFEDVDTIVHADLKASITTRPDWAGVSEVAKPWMIFQYT